MKKILCHTALLLGLLVTNVSLAASDIEEESFNMVGLREVTRLSFEGYGYGNLSSSRLIEKRGLSGAMLRGHEIVNLFGNTINLIPVKLDGSTKYNAFNILYPKVPAPVCYGLVTSLLEEFDIITIGDTLVRNYNVVDGIVTLTTADNITIQNLCHQDLPITFTAR